MDIISADDPVRKIREHTKVTKKYQHALSRVLYEEFSEKYQNLLSYDEFKEIISFKERPNKIRRIADRLKDELGKQDLIEFVKYFSQYTKTYRQKYKVALLLYDTQINCFENFDDIMHFNILLAWVGIKKIGTQKNITKTPKHDWITQQEIDFLTKFIKNYNNYKEDREKAVKIVINQLNIRMHEHEIDTKFAVVYCESILQEIKYENNEIVLALLKNIIDEIKKDEHRKAYLKRISNHGLTCKNPEGIGRKQRPIIRRKIAEGYYVKDR
jgi:hypothetical protein